MSTVDIVWRLALAGLLVAANGFFVAAEFALVGARRTRIDALVRQGNRRAQLARDAIKNLDYYISGTQLGITLASLGLGWVGESTLAALFIQVFGGLGEPWTLLASHAVAGIIAFAFITVMHIVLGELAPKSVALLHPEAVSLWTAGPLVAFSKVLRPFIWLLNGLANSLLRLFGQQPATEIEHVHQPGEIEMMVHQSHRHGHIGQEPVSMIEGVFDLSEMTAAQVMTPRTEIVALPAEASLEDATELILEAGHSRVPVYDGSLDEIIGLVLAREVWRAQRDGPPGLGELVRPIPFVPDSKPIEELLRDMQRDRVHMAAVVDEFGGTAGLVTIEDLVEEIVGEIHDEHEQEPPEIEEVGAGELRLDGTVSLAELNDDYPVDLPADEHTTAAGLVMGLLGRIPREGEEVEHGGARFRVVAMDGRRVERLALRLEGEPDEEPVGENA